MTRRPPILAAISQNDTAGGIVIHRALVGYFGVIFLEYSIFQNQYLAIPALLVTLLNAMNGKNFNVRVAFNFLKNTA